MTMHASVTVIIRPTITGDSAIKLRDVILDRLWPGAAGGAQFLTNQHMAKPLGRLLAEVVARGKETKVKFTRNGMDITMEPA